MHRRSFIWFGVCLVASGAASDFRTKAAEEPGDKRQGAVCLGRIESPNDLADAIDKLLSKSASDDLNRLVATADCTCALAASWERVRRTMPATEHDDVVTPDPLAVARFLGLVEGRLQVPIPKVWEETVKSARGYAHKNIWFPPSDQILKGRREAVWHVERNAGQWSAKRGKKSIKLPALGENGLPYYAAAERAGDTAYVAVYDDVVMGPYQLFAIDQRNGNVVWSSAVWRAQRVYPRTVVVNGVSVPLIVGTSGSDWHVVTLRSSGELLVVFGFSGGAVYVEAFDRKTGENRCRFSSAFFAIDAFLKPD